MSSNNDSTSDGDGSGDLPDPSEEIARYLLDGVARWCSEKARAVVAYAERSLGR